MKYLVAALALFFLSFSPPVDKLFEIFEISEKEEALALWLQTGKERWQFDQCYEELKPQLWPLFEELGMLSAVYPSQPHYDYVLVHGALLSRVQDRIAFLSKLEKNGTRFRHIVFLTGARPLLDWEKDLTDLETEREMVEWVYERSDLPKDIPVTFVNAPPKPTGRPQTIDTLLTWLQSFPPPGTCLAISNQPYIHYQDAVVKKFLPVETVGPGIQADPSVALMLDTLAKELLFLSKG